MVCISIELNYKCKNRHIPTYLCRIVDCRHVGIHIQLISHMQTQFPFSRHFYCQGFIVDVQCAACIITTDTLVISIIRQYCFSLSLAKLLLNSTLSTYIKSPVQHYCVFKCKMANVCLF
uniref:Uncharacterized protein n=1 Tax=Cacopsylla melanoneura TaxID=428564 RepID=A0A8D9DVW7_9HEMI